MRGVGSSGEVNRRTTGGVNSRTLPSRRNFFGAGTSNQHIARRALLQQKFRGLHDRVSVETRSHHAILQDVREGHQRHALMMRHVRVDDRDVLPFRNPGLGVVQ